MTATDQQLRALAFLAKACRPNGARRWDEAGIMAALAKVADRSLAEVVLATVRAAADRDCETPGVIPTAGSHWRSAAVEVGPTPTPPKFRSESGPKLSTEEYAGHAAKARALIQHTSGPAERKGLEDMAAANPELHARVEALRANNPGLQSPPLQAPEPPPPGASAATEPSAAEVASEEVKA